MENLLYTSGTSVAIATGENYTIKDDEVYINNVLYRKEDVCIKLANSGSTQDSADVLVGIESYSGSKIMVADLLAWDKWKINDSTPAGLEELLSSISSGIEQVGEKYLDGFAIGDETTDLTTGTKLTVYLPISLTNVTFHASVTTAPTGAALIIDVHKAGTTMMTTNKITIDAGEYNTNTAATPPGVTTSTYTAFDKLEIIIDQIGSTVAGAGAKVWIEANKV